jgi:hypothetical protein
VETVARLRTAEGVRTLDAADSLLGRLDLLAAAACMRTSGTDAELAAAALTPAGLRHRAAAKFGPVAALRRDLRLSGTASATLVMTRLRTRPVALLCRPCVSAAPDRACRDGGGRRRPA